MINFSRENVGLALSTFSRKIQSFKDTQCNEFATSMKISVDENSVLSDFLSV